MDNKDKDKIIDAYDDKIKTFDEIKKLEGEELRGALIDWTAKAKLGLDLEGLTFNDKPYSEYELFAQKKELVLSFCKELWDKTFKRIQIDHANSIVISKKLVSVGETLNELRPKETLSANEVEKLIGEYKKIFEIVKKTIEPYFKIILNKEPFLEWSEISKELNNFDGNYKPLFKNMNGTLRDAVAHESTYTGQDLFIWIKEDGTRTEYPLEKVFNKIDDLFSLLLCLFWGQSEVQVNHIIEVYKILPADKLKDIINNISM